MKLCKNIYSKLGRKTYIDVTGTWLRYPGDPERCRGNGEHKNIFGKVLECCCEECDYGLECQKTMIQKGVFDEL